MKIIVNFSSKGYPSMPVFFRNFEGKLVAVLIIMNWGVKMKELSEKFEELKSIILKSKKFSVREDFHLFVLLEEISTKINQKVKKWKLTY